MIGDGMLLAKDRSANDIKDCKAPEVLLREAPAVEMDTSNDVGVGF